MTDAEIISLIDNSLVEEFELESSAMVPEAGIFDDLGLDSLDIVDMVVVLEGSLGIKIRDDEGLREIRTLGDIHRFILQKKRETEATS
ncbi:MAG: phosphopantetheine-binding protein [Pseudomonadota bacterium]|nr:phosphopantetheine-binding protein [Pseudomonadota bacterium]